MKITALLIIAFCFQVTAKSYGQSVNLTFQNASLKTVIEAFSNQSKLDFVYEDRYMSQANPVTINLKNTSIQAALKAIFSNQPFQYEVEDGIVYIKPKAMAPSDKSQLTVRGKVTDSIGQGLHGVVVEVVGTNIKTATDRDGRYQLQNLTTGSKLTFRLLGYESQTVSVNNSDINITLSQVMSQLDEVIVSKGYYNVTKELNTGSVSSVKAMVLQRQPVGNPIFALSGRVPGLYVQQNNGTPGSAPNISLRGRNSIANANQPLIVIDGVPYYSEYSGLYPSGAAGAISPLANIPLSSIESIDILKDADATAIYGSRGANGVILFTTKKASTEATSIQVDFNRGIGNVSSKIKLMNTQQYLNVRREAFRNDGISFGNTDYDVNGTWDTTRYTDWQKLMIGGTAQLSNANIAINGGNSHTKFSLAGSYRNESTVFPGNSGSKQFGVNVSLNHESQDRRFKVSYSGFLSNQDILLPQTDFTTYINLAPNAPQLYKEDGSLNWENSTWSNPFRALYLTSSTNTYNLNGDLSITYKILDRLFVSSRFGYNSSGLKGINLTPLKGSNPAFGMNPGNRRHQLGENVSKSWIIEPMLNYNLNFLKNDFDFLIGTTLQELEREEFQILGTGFSSDVQLANLASATTNNVSNSSESLYKYAAIYSRLGYTYNDRYVLNLTGRRDGSSRFGPGKQFGNFWAIGTAWLFSKEPYFPKKSIISLGKLRASYGITGNDQLGDYKFISAYSSTGKSYQGVSGILPIQHTNPDYSWETVKKLETGLELGAWDNKIQLTINWYKNRTGNQLVGYPLPQYTGFPSVQANLPAVIQNSGLELEFSLKPLNNNNFSWVIDANLTIPRNKLVSYPNLENSTYATRYQIGRALTGAFLYRFTGIDAESQVLTFEDINNDGFIRSANDRAHTFIGQKAHAGLNNSLTICNHFVFDIFLQYVNQQGYQFLSAWPPGVLVNSGNNPPIDILAGNSIFTRFSQSTVTPTGNGYMLLTESDAIIGDASFLRIKNVAFSWNATSHIIKALKLSNLTIYTQAQNLLTFTNYKGLDPEVMRISGSSGVPRLPTLRMVTFGIQVSI